MTSTPESNAPTKSPAVGTGAMPAIALGFEPSEPDVMKRKPRPPRESIFAHGLGLHVVWVGLWIGVATLIGFVLEIGPVAGIFPVVVALSLELPTLGFLPYLALAASAAVGLHLSEEEPTPKEKKPEAPGGDVPRRFAGNG